MKILFIGEIVSQPGRTAVKEVLPGIIKEEKIDLVLSNAENLSGGRGATIENLAEMEKAGIHYFSGGDHIFWQKETEDELDNLPVIRPANYPNKTPGKGYSVIDTGKTGKVLFINLMGRTSFNSLFSYLDDPFTKFDQILEETKDDYAAIIVDFHAEATSEKEAFGFYTDGKATAVIGTHTHSPTADNIVLPKGTLYITDVGMTGNIDSVLGVKKEIIIDMFLTARNQRFEWEKSGRKAFRSVLLDTNTSSIIRKDKLII